jgi:phage terminase large subunit-like protein
MTAPLPPTSRQIAQLPPYWRGRLFRSLAVHRLQQLLEHWPLWARADQMAPEGRWRTWLLLGGRGSGKTRAAAEWVREMIESGTCSSAALIGPTFADVRDVMVQGVSGLIANASRGHEPVYQSSLRRLVWPCGGQAMLFSAEDPDSLRGPQFDLAWGDEIAAWPKADTVLDVLRPAMRVGEDPRMVLSTTPRPIPAVKRLLADPACRTTRASTSANSAHLAPTLMEDLLAQYGNSIQARQELGGELIDDPVGALWCRADLDAARARFENIPLDRMIVAVDPPASAGANADTCGIIVAGSTGWARSARAMVLADCSVQGLLPRDWARAVTGAFEAYEADLIVAEANQGGEMVRAVLQEASPGVPVRLVHAGRSKVDRAAPVTVAYASGRVGHAGYFRELEDQMCCFGPHGTSSGSPDRVDALVWAITELLLTAPALPRARSL